MRKMIKNISSIVVFTYLFSILSLVIPQLGVQALAATTLSQNHTFETTDPNFGSFSTGTTLSATTVPATAIGSEQTGATGAKENVAEYKIVAEASGNRVLQETIPASTAARNRFFYSSTQVRNNYNFEETISIDNQLKEFDLVTASGADWGCVIPLVKFLPTGDIQVRTQTSTSSSYIYVKRGTWTANTKYTVKVAMYTDTANYDAFITSAGQTTMIASGEYLPDYKYTTTSAPITTTDYKFLQRGNGYFNMQAAANTGATASTTITYDNVKLSYSDDVRVNIPSGNDYTPPADNIPIRTTTFETNDTDATIAGTATGANVLANILGNNSKSVRKIVATTTGRALEVDTLANTVGDLSFPTDPSWSPTIFYKGYTLEADFTMMDKNADYNISLVTGNWGSFKPNIVKISKDGKIYARSTNDSFEGMAARATWTVGQTFSLKIVVHADTLSYDLYYVTNGVSTKLVNSEPIEISTLYATKGIAEFLLSVPSGIHSASAVLVDNIKLSASNLTGTAPVVNATPGTLYDNSPKIGIPINYYVSPTGLDTNDGKSADKPFKSPQKAADLTAPGDTVYFMGGTYTSTGESILNIKNSGAPTANITYKAYNNEKPVLRLDKGWNVVTITTNYIVVDGINVEGSAKERNLELAEEIYDYYIDWVDNKEKLGEALNRDYISQTNTNGITFNGTATNPIHHLTIKNCEVANMTAGGIGGSKADYVTIENNNIHDNCIYDMYACSGISVLGSLDVDANTTDYKIKIINNISAGNISQIKWSAVGIRRMSDSNGCILDFNSNSSTPGAKPYAGKFLVANNEFYNNGGSGFHAFETSNADAINNTIYKNAQNPGLKSYSNTFSSNGINNRFLNNIVYAGPNDLITKAPEDSTIIFANNIYYGSQAPAYMGKNDKFIDPKFVDLAAKDFHLAADSPAIDQGTKTLAPLTDYEGNVRPRGNGFDIGAHESSYASDTPLVDNELDLVAMAKSTFVYGAAQAVKGTPVIDGDIDSMWVRAQKFSPKKYISGNLNNIYATADAKVMWDENNLYVLAIVKDPVLSDKGTAAYFIDSVEAFLDQNNGKTVNYDAAPDDGQYRVDYKNTRSGSSWFTATTFNSAAKVTADGYIVEMVIPLSTTAAVGREVGFDFQINDADVNGVRQHSATWSDPLGKGYSNTSKWGTITLVDELSATVATVAAGITSVVAPAKDATSLTLPVVPAGYTLAIKSATPAGVIGTDAAITPPTSDTSVAMVFTVTKTDGGATADTTSIDVVVPAKTVVIPSITAATVAAGITSVVAPAKDAKILILPTVPEGYTIAIKSATSTILTIALNGTITPPKVNTTVAVVFKVTKLSDNSTADTVSINVVVPAKTVIDSNSQNIDKLYSFLKNLNLLWLFPYLKKLLLCSI